MTTDNARKILDDLDFCCNSYDQHLILIIPRYDVHRYIVDDYGCTADNEVDAVIEKLSGVDLLHTERDVIDEIVTKMREIEEEFWTETE